MATKSKNFLKKLIDDHDISILGIDSRYTTSIEEFIALLDHVEESKAYTLHVKLHRPEKGKYV